jgi:hypothetical protein
MRRKVRRVAMTVPVALALGVAMATPSPAAIGFLTSEPAQISLGPDAPPGSSILPIITVGEVVDGTMYAGIPDGIGLMPGPGGTVFVYVNHEESEVPFQGRADYVDSSVTRWRLAPDGSVLSGKIVIDERLGFIRFCSATMAGPEEGLDRYIFFTNEESSDVIDVPAHAPYGPDPSLTPNRQAGYSLAYDTDTSQLTVLDSLGRHNHENTMVVPGGWEQIALLSGDDTFAAPSSQLYLSLAADEDAVMADQSTLWAYRVDEVNGSPVNPESRFNGANDYGDITVGDVFGGEFIRVPEKIARGNTGVAPQTALENWSNKNNVFQFIRIEDTAYDKTNPRVVYLADTGERRAIADPHTGRLARGPSSTFGPYMNGRIFKMTFDAADPRRADLEILLNSDLGGYSNPSVMHQPDNMGTSLNSLMVQEDSAQAPNSRVWRYDLLTETWSVVAQVNDFDWESSGIVDASASFGPGTWLLNVQAHDILQDAVLKPNGITVKREGGQLLLLTLPGT